MKQVRLFQKIDSNFLGVNVLQQLLRAFQLAIFFFVFGLTIAGL
jgi:hypothetical protein